MGVLQRFERRLEGLVNGAFAKAFKSEVQPVEIASALQRECDDRAAPVSQGRVMVPNDFTVELGAHDYERLATYAGPLSAELGELLQEHGREQRYMFVGPVEVKFERVQDLTTGMFRIRSQALAGVVQVPGYPPQQAPGYGAPQPQGYPPMGGEMPQQGFAVVYDSDVAHVTGLDPGGREWRAVLGLGAAAEWGVERPEYVSNDLVWIESPRYARAVAAERERLEAAVPSSAAAAIAWAGAAGAGASPGAAAIEHSAVEAVLRAHEVFVEDGFFALLDVLGFPPAQAHAAHVAHEEARPK